MYIYVYICIYIKQTPQKKAKRKGIFCYFPFRRVKGEEYKKNTQNRESPSEAVVNSLRWAAPMASALRLSSNAWPVLITRPLPFPIP